MYDHHEEPAGNNTRAFSILNDVHNIFVPDLLIEIGLVIFAGLSNLALIIVEIKGYRKTGSLSLPKQLIFWLALVDAIGVFIGLLPRLFVAGIESCPVLLFSTIHMLSITVQVFAILMSKLTVVLMGIERYTSILRPFFYVRACTPGRFLAVEIICCIYSAIFAATSSFFNYYHYYDTVMYYKGIEYENCLEKFLVFEFGSINHSVDFPWRYAEICGTFQFYQLAQDILLIIILIICNSAVMRGLRVMDERMRTVCPQTAPNERASPSTPSFQGREFSRLMTMINVFVLLLTTPQMVRNLCNYIHVAPSYVADYVCQRVALLSACVNPVLYGILRQSVRTSIKQLLCLGHGSRAIEPSGGSTSQSAQKTQTSARN